LGSAAWPLCGPSRHGAAQLCGGAGEIEAQSLTFLSAIWERAASRMNDTISIGSLEGGRDAF
jgi:hypothetical protein